MIFVYRTSKETQARKDAKKNHIIKTAATIFSEKGYNGTTIAAVVQKADISTGTFYFYFKNKESLFEQIYDTFIQLLDRVSRYALDKEAMDNVMGFCRSKTSELWIFQENKGLARAMMVESTLYNPLFEKKREELYKRSNSRIEKIFSEIQSNGSLTQYNARTCALLCNGTMYNVISDWLQGGIPGALLDYAYPIVTFNLNALNIEYSDKVVHAYIEEMIHDMESFNPWEE